MKELMTIAVAVALSASLLACGRDDRQEKTGAAATDAQKGASSAPMAGADPASGATKGPLQTGEQPPAGPQVLDGTTTGARTTPDPK
jgi:hypothetical protein